MPNLDADAVDYILRQIATNPDYRYLLGWGSGAFDKLTEARAARVGKTPDDIRDEVLAIPDAKLGPHHFKRR